MVSIRESKDDFILDFNDLEGWDDFEQIVEILKRNYEVEVVERVDGPESRAWQLSLDGLLFSLHNNPYGNYLKAKEPDSIVYLKETLDHIRVHFM